MVVVDVVVVVVVDVVVGVVVVVAVVVVVVVDVVVDVVVVVGDSWKWEDDDLLVLGDCPGSSRRIWLQWLMLDDGVE
jgi:hypothetical protein